MKNRIQLEHKPKTTATLRYLNSKSSNVFPLYLCLFFLAFFSLKYLEISLKNKCDNIRESIPNISIKNCNAFIVCVRILLYCYLYYQCSFGTYLRQ